MRTPKEFARDMVGGSETPTIRTMREIIIEAIIKRDSEWMEALNQVQDAIGDWRPSGVGK